MATAEARSFRLIQATPGSRGTGGPDSVVLTAHWTHTTDHAERAIAQTQMVKYLTGEGDVAALSEAEIGVKPDHDVADLDTRCSE